MSQIMTIPYPLRPIFDGITDAFPVQPREASAASMFKAFEMIDDILASLEQGEVYVEAGVPVIPDDDGGWCEIAPALHGWCDCWERIARHMRADLDLGHFRRLANRLDRGVPLTLSDVARAKAITDRCRALYLACPPSLRESAVRDELVAIELDRAGIRRAA